MFKPLVIGSTLIAVFLNFVGVTSARAVQLKVAHRPPGKRIDIGGYSLHIYCEGAGRPTIIMDAGLGNPGMAWTYVQPEVAKKTRVCIYDRAGLGWSDPSPRERTLNVMVDELHRLLREANIEAPYVLVGHSFGGLILRMYAHAYPNDVKGLVLVDSYHYTQMEKYPKVHGKDNLLLPLLLHLLDLWVESGIPALDPSLMPTLDLGKLPPKVSRTYQDLTAADPKSVKEMQAELASLEESSLEEKDAKITTLGDIPLTVLAHGYLESRLLDPIGTKNHEEYEAFWRADQAELASLSPQGQLIVAEKSGHYIQFDEPDLVITAIEQVLLKAQA